MEEVQLFDEKILEKYRKILFPEIKGGIITGYNVYYDKPVRTYQFLINYLHSDLGFDEKGKPHKHREELLKKLSKVGKLNFRKSLVNSIIDRIAIYKIGDWEENPENLRFFDSEGNLILYKDMNKYEGVLIAEGKQYNLGVELDNLEALNLILNLLNKYTYACKLTSKGKLENKKNQHAIYGAWEIPLIVVGLETPLKRQDFRRVFEFNIKDEKHDICALVRKHEKKLNDHLRRKTLNFYKTKKYANRPFVELYLDKEL